MCLPVVCGFPWPACRLEFSEGSLYGLSVSGFAAKNALTHGILQGPLILTGGTFGPEASIIAVILCLGTAVFLLWRAAKIGRIQPPLWSRHNPPVALSSSTASEFPATLILEAFHPRLSELLVFHEMAGVRLQHKPHLFLGGEFQRPHRAASHGR